MICYCCNLEKELAAFPKTGKNYISNKCKTCTSTYKKQRKDIVNPVVSKQCSTCNNKFNSRINSMSTTCRACLSFSNTQKIRSINTCKTCSMSFAAKYIKTAFCSRSCFDNRVSKADEFKEWYEVNKEHRKQYHRNKYKHDINFRLADILRSRIRNALKNAQKSGSAVRDLGCSINKLKQHLESKFQEGMSWDNYGKWHIDHIIPLSMFNLEDREQLLKACHYSNLQPLWAVDNLKKSAKLYHQVIMK